LTLAQSRHLGPSIAVGSAAGLSYSDALTRSIEEAVTSWRSSYRAMYYDTRLSSNIERSMRISPNLGDHALYYARHENVHHFSFLHYGISVSENFQILEQKVNLRNSQEILRGLLEHLAGCQCRIVLIDLTPLDVRSVGLTVIRAVTLDLVRQSVGLVARHLNHERLLSIPLLLNLPSQVTTKQGLLAEVHPFP